MSEKNEIALVNEKDLSLVEDNSLNAAQLKIILTKTPAKYVKKRPAKGGGQWSYVTGGYIKKCLNLMFGWDWDFEIVDERIMIEEKEVVVKGRLTCRSNGKTIVKMQFGNKDIMFKKNSKEPLSIGNDMKAAATDALKKCASEIGIAADIYNADEFREINVEVKDNEDLIGLLQDLFAEKGGLLKLKEQQNIKRIIDNREALSYKKAFDLLTSAK